MKRFYDESIKMSCHPNAMLILALTPDGLARKTYRAILEDAGIDSNGSFKIGGKYYHQHGVMENDYDKGNQLGLPKGTIYVFSLVTYGYGETIKWADLEMQKVELDEWAKAVCEKHNCSAEILVSANYW